MQNELILTLRAFGPLRLALITLVIIDMLLRPEPGVRLTYEGILVIPNLIAPVLSPILFMLLLLDTMMALVYRSGQPVEVKARYKTIAFVVFALAIVLFLRWLPFFKMVQDAY